MASSDRGRSAGTEAGSPQWVTPSRCEERGKTDLPRVLPSTIAEVSMEEQSGRRRRETAALGCGRFGRGNAEGSLAETDCLPRHRSVSPVRTLAESALKNAAGGVINKGEEGCGGVQRHLSRTNIARRSVHKFALKKIIRRRS